MLRSNRNMLKFTEAFGFTTHDDPDDPEQVGVVLELSRQRRGIARSRPQCATLDSGDVVRFPSANP